MKSILFLIFALATGQLAAQSEKSTKPESEKYAIDTQANEKGMSEIRKKKAERQQKNIRKYKGKKSHVSQTDQTVKPEEVIIPTTAQKAQK